MPDSPKDAGDVEITPEMIEAGVSELVLYEQGVDNGYDVVVRIFLAMQTTRILQHAEIRSSGS